MNTDLNRHKTMRHESPEQRVSLVREMFARVLEHAKQLNVEVRLQSSFDLEKPGASTVGFELKALAVAWLVMIALPAVAGEVTLGWSASTTPGVTNYILFCNTNTITEENKGEAIKIKTGLATGAQVRFPGTNLWYFAAAADKQAALSDLSNVHVVEFPSPPTDTRSVAVDWTLELQTEWKQAAQLFFRLRPQ